MKNIKITIKGTTPLLANAFTDEAQRDSSNGSRLATQKERGTPREQAEAVLYKDNNGKPVIPGPNLFRCIIEGGRFFKAGKSKITTQKNSLIPACLEFEEIVINIKHKEPWTVDTRPVRIPSTGGRILRHRPCFNDWELSFSCLLDDDVITENLLREIIDTSGRRIGLGDFRPDCKGPFGKFVVTKWEIKK